jgi:hypothetical protein
MIPVENVPRVKRGGMKKHGRGDEFKYDIFDIL